MNTPNLPARLAIAAATATAAAVLVSGVALAHPESEGSHPSGCIVIVEPASVTAGSQFTVSGNFGRASIYIVKGVNTPPAEGAVADATTPEGDSFSVTFTSEASDVGDLTVWGVIPETECGDGDGLTVTAGVPNTAVDRSSRWDMALGGVILLAAAITAAARQFTAAPAAPHRD